MLKSYKMHYTRSNPEANSMQDSACFFVCILKVSQLLCCRLAFSTLSVVYGLVCFTDRQTLCCLAENVYACMQHIMHHIRCVCASFDHLCNGVRYWCVVPEIGLGDVLIQSWRGVKVSQSRQQPQNPLALLLLAEIVAG